MEAKGFTTLSPRCPGRFPQPGQYRGEAVSQRRMNVRCKQIDIAEVLGLDVSSVNKILNRTRGPVFAQETIRRVFECAKRLGYDFRRGRAGLAKLALRNLIEGGHVQGVSATKLRLYRKIAGC